MQIVRLKTTAIDPLLILLAGTIAFAVLLPAHGLALRMVDHGVTIWIAALFLFYGARLAPTAILAGLVHWRLQSLVLASTYLLFPVMGVVAARTFGSALPADLATGLVFFALVPSTVQSSVTFTAIARGNVPAALCSASLSNLLGVVATPLLVSQLLPVPAWVSRSGLSKISRCRSWLHS